MDENNPIKAIITNIPVFKDLSMDSVNLLTSKITLEYYPAGHIIFRKGDEGDSMFIIKKGRVKIYQGSDDEPFDQIVIATLTDNSFFGEMALVSERVRNASAKTETDCEVFILKKEDFYALINDNPSMAEQIGKEFIDRIKSNMRNDQFEQ